MKIKNFSLNVGKKNILKNVSYDFKDDIIYNIYGPNGSGKSTFVKALMGYISHEGTSEFKDKRIGLVSSYANIPEEVSVKDIINFLKAKTNAENNYEKKLYDICDINKIITRKKIAVLSDGEKKKLMIYSALVYKKDVLLLDEFIANLDKNSSNEIRKFILNIHKNFKFVCLNITHSIADAKILQGKILYLNTETKSFDEIYTTNELIDLI